MDDFERDLAVALKQAAPPPPRNIDPMDIIRTGAERHRRRWIAPLLAALLVAAVAGVALGLAGSGPDHHTTVVSPGPTGSPPPQRPAAIIDTWRLTDLQGLAGAAHTQPQRQLTFHIRADGTIVEGCAAARVTITAGHLIFRQPFITATPTNCPNLGVTQSNFLFGTVLTGTAAWRVIDNRLTITNGNAGATFVRTSANASVLKKRLWHIAADAARNNTTIARAEAVQTSEFHALALTNGGEVPGNPPVWLIQIEAPTEFVCNTCHGPVAVHGRFITITVNARTFVGLDFGVTDQRVDLSTLGNVVELHP
jgi:heat shock protein HslJ